MNVASPPEQLAPVGEVEIAFDDRGDRDAPAILLVPGLGTQMIYWDNDFCEMLVDRGYRVIRMDNRDCGHSTVLDAKGKPGLVPMMLGVPRHLRYSMSDMAADGIGVLDHLGIERAHIAGFSMGGMIVQTMAIEHPERIRSLTSIMSRTGAYKDALPGAKELVALMKVGPDDLDGFLENMRRLADTIGSPAYPADPEWLRAQGVLAYERGLHRDGTARQLHAINCQPNRTRRLRKLDLPALVMHGSADRLVFTRGGRATARAIPGAKLRIYEGMGHDLPQQLWPQFAAEIDAIASRA
ncbi:MAG TPA: alpha/beta hydrolase [Solirubrobacterales bacterium]|nr:alpha/beta hydrolase [Solirubrobacterales bacterium]